MSALGDLVSGALRQVELELAAHAEREIELTAAEQFARDPIGWIETYVWIASKFDDGQRLGKVRARRMRLFPDQRRTIAAWVDLDHLERTGELRFRNLVIEKSRQIGETWLFAAVFAWALHYHVLAALAIHQRAAEIADRGFTHRSLFGKIRYIDQRLDERMPGRGRLDFYPFSTDPAKIVNASTGAALYGECQRDDPGRGGTFDAILADEAARLRHGETVWSAISDACEEGIALLSTPNGSDTFHARIADEEPEGWTYLRLHWSTHPVYRQGLHVAALPPADGQPGRHADRDQYGRGVDDEMRQAAEACQLCAGVIAGLTWVARAPRAHRFPGRLASPWYDRAVNGKTIEQVASELDIDRERSLAGRVYDEFEAAIHVARDAAGDEIALPFDRDLGPLELGWDYGLDCTAVVICQDTPTEYRVLGEVELVDQPGETPTPDNVAEAVREELRELGVPVRELDPRWTRRLYARGDPAGEGRTLSTGRPLTSDYRREGFEIRKPPANLTREVATSVTAVKRLLLGQPKPLRVSARCTRFVRHARHNRWPTDALGHRRIGSTRPLDDEHNHMMRAFAYLVVAKFPPAPASGGRDPDPWDDTDSTLADRSYGSLVDDLEPLGYDAKT